MISVLLGLALSAPRTIIFEQGASYPWVQDVTLDGSQPDVNRGGEGILEGGPGRTILIRFPELRRAIGGRVKVVSAELTFVVSGPSQPKLRSVNHVPGPWSEGPIRTLADMVKTAPGPAPKGTATWRNRRAGADSQAWPQAGGATGEKLDSVAVENRTQDTLTLTGLGPAVQRWVNQDWSNHGVALSFEQRCEFFSSNAGAGRPQLKVVVEDQATPTGADLSVTLISRAPAYERYDLAPDQPTVGGVAFPSKIANATSRRWPNDGEEVTYTAVIKNVGTEASDAFQGQWSVRDEPGAIASGPALAPGEETTVTIKRPFKNSPGDHRHQSLRFTVNAADADPDNDSLDIQEGALSVGVWVPADAPKDIEDRVQRACRMVNLAFDASRFSFASEGAKERIRIQAIRRGPLQKDTGLDVEVAWTGDDWLTVRGFAPLAAGLGLPDYSQMNAVPTFTEYRAVDRFSGLAGGGDTRSDAPLPSLLTMIQEPTYDPFQSSIMFESVGLLASTDVAALNSNLGRRRGLPADILFDLPENIAVRFLTPDGLPIAGAEVRVYQSSNGKMGDVLPLRVVKSSDSGFVALPNQATGESGVPITVTGHALRPNAFGRVDAFSGNGLLVFEVRQNNQVEYAFLKVWAAVDAYHRGNRGFAQFDYRLPLPTTTLDKDRNLAPTTLRGFADGDLATPVDAGTDELILDLGRDRMAGEVRVFGLERFWPKFEIQIFGTGDDPASARIWVRELDAAWTAANRASTVDGARSVAYRGRAQRFRYLKFVNRSAAKAAGTLNEVRVVPVKAGN